MKKFWNPFVRQCLAALFGVGLLGVSTAVSGQTYVAPPHSPTPAPFDVAIGVDALQLLSGMAVLTAEKSLLPELAVRMEAGAWTGDVLEAGMLPQFGEWERPEITGGHHASLGVRVYPSLDDPKSSRLFIGFDATQSTYDFHSYNADQTWVHRELRAVLGVLKPIGDHVALTGHLAFSGGWNDSSAFAVRASGVNTDFRSWTRWGGLGLAWIW